MASKLPTNTRPLVLAGVAAFMAGCWIGMGSESSGEPFCVVTADSAAARAGVPAGQLVEQPSDGCLPGEPEVCGRFENGDDDEHFVSDSCPDD
jgi:hypothetical protein